MAASGEPDATEQRGRLERTLDGIEASVLGLVLGGMVALAGLQIVLRNGFDTGLPWIDPLLRASVLWIGLLGALAASRADRQIRVDVLPLGLPVRARAVVHALASVFTAIVCALVALASGRFVADEHAFGSIAFAGIPAFVVQIVIPVAFGLMAALHAGHALRSIGNVRRPRS